ncbi:hypothetical protein [Ideonella alba]|uniref:Secreted protein n=1 Tax=Ideonella alba TaxID=2824118 RepID=A0A941BCK1_9BURK|nr:hypothetical protein [Ideonella alba]MBQ0929236.1 hypothetical protein [Ideonella alba]
MKTPSTSPTLRAGLVALALAGLAGGALADAANPVNDTTVNVVQNGDSSTTVTMSGTWWWAGQNCTGRYGVAWSVDWWGVSTRTTPVPSFTMSNATVVLAHGSTTRADVNPAGAIAIPGGTYFHTGPKFSGEVPFSKTTCRVEVRGGVSGATGAWSAEATYPAGAQLPPQLCVNMYDPHGKAGSPSNKAADLSPILQKDNSIQTNAYAPGGGNCAAMLPPPPPPVP